MILTSTAYIEPNHTWPDKRPTHLDRHVLKSLPSWQHVLFPCSFLERKDANPNSLFYVSSDISNPRLCIRIRYCLHKGKPSLSFFPNLLSFFALPLVVFRSAKGYKIQVNCCRLWAGGMVVLSAQVDWLSNLENPLFFLPSAFQIGLFSPEWIWLLTTRSFMLQLSSDSRYG